MSILFTSHSQDAETYTSVVDAAESGYLLPSLADTAFEFDSTLPRRKRKRHEPKTIDNSQEHFGVDIYDLLRKIEAPLAPSVAQAPAHKRRRTRGYLLTEKYRPQKFIDLLGSDKTHRRILKWLSHWKSVVFGADSDSQASHGPGQTGQAGGADNTDRLGRPHKKILLLHGPPGAGKTTAAHVIAKQAGYDILEVNASDERTASIVKEKITGALQSHRVTSSRPVCLVVDEIEGATEHGFVKNLVDLINADSRVLAGKPRKRDSLLQRPIICLCNDAWTASLASLRPLAEIASFPRQSVGQISAKLEEICMEEKISYKGRELQEIVEICGGDLRACLNAIQFGEAGAKDIVGGSVAAKQFSSKPALFSDIEASDIDKTLISCFSTYPQASFVDDMLGKPCALSDWLGLVDCNRLGGAPREIQAAAIHAFGQMFKSAAAPPVIARAPNTYDISKQVKDLTGAVKQKVSQRLRYHLTQQTMINHMIPFISKMACPFTHSVPDEEDKRRISLCCQTLTDFGVDLRSSKLDNGSIVLLLEPPIQQVCVFGEDMQNAVASWKYIARQQMREQFIRMKSRIEPSQAGTIQTLASQPQPVVLKEIPKKYDFFGKEIVEPDTPSQVGLAERKIWVQYMEGFSNAVRKPISWKEVFHKPRF